MSTSTRNVTQAIIDALPQGLRSPQAGAAGTLATVELVLRTYHTVQASDRPQADKDTMLQRVQACIPILVNTIGSVANREFVAVGPNAFYEAADELLDKLTAAEAAAYDQSPNLVSA